MKLLDLTLSGPAENLALDEALLNRCESQAAGDREVVRIWQSPAPLVVVGRASRVDEEVNRSFCQRHQIPVLRRCSGGATVVATPGCLMYAVVLDLERRPSLQMIETTHQFVLGRLAEALQRQGVQVVHQGISDLTWHERKVSGNSLRVKRRSLLYHGTLLYDAPLDLIQNCLRMPPRQPEYRQQREHRQFLTNLPLGPSQLRHAVIEAWQPDDVLSPWPEQDVRQLVAERYEQPEWNLRR